jgi:hypothetical protein
MLPVSTVYALFFGAAVFVLFLIFCAKMPELWRSWRRFARQMVARRTREERMLADLEKLMAEARRLEGIYCFERFETHHAPVKSARARQSLEAAPESIAC